MASKYRPNVAAVIQRTDGRLLIAQRADYPECWQFPQGGIDRGESAEEAVRREIMEEVGLAPSTYRIADHRGPYRYDFPHGPDRRGFIGQEQSYFLCLLTIDPPPPFDPAATCGEFLAVRWVDRGAFPVELAPAMKQEVYRRVLVDLFGADAKTN